MIPQSKRRTIIVDDEEYEYCVGFTSRQCVYYTYVYIKSMVTGKTIKWSKALETKEIFGDGDWRSGRKPVFIPMHPSDIRKIIKTETFRSKQSLKKRIRDIT